MSEDRLHPYSTEQERFWAGSFGNEYVDRNRDEELVSTNLRFFAAALERSTRIGSVIELGCNVGLNLIALRHLLPGAPLRGVEINARAVQVLEQLFEARGMPRPDVTLGSLFDYDPGDAADLVFTKGVLIHLDPKRLSDAYERLFTLSKRYILIAEYYNPAPTEVRYRDHAERLFKRDFAGELLTTYPSLELIDYGFVYRRDPKWPQDDLTWFLLEKGPHA